jgi:DNA-directed RNA polymerase subunit F
MFGDLIEKRPVTIVEAKAILKEIKKRNYEQNMAFEYAAKFSKLTEKKAAKLLGELTQAGIPRIKDRHLAKLIDVMPETPEEVRAVFSKEDITLNKEDTDKIMKILVKHR